MKIVQISVTSAVTPDYAENIYGLGQDGLPYIWESTLKKWVIA